MSRKSVLVVDDDSSIRMMVRAVLSREGYEVDESPSGNDAIARIRAKHYDAMILDLMMRGGSGEDVLRSVAAQRPDMKCVVVISAGSQSTIDNIADVSVAAKLRKPFDIAQLVEAIRHCIPG